MIAELVLWVAPLLFAVGARDRPSSEPIWTLRLKGASAVEADIQNNVYVLRAGELSKYDADGQGISRFSKPEYGVPDRLDASDPLRLMLHYKRFQRLIWLDNRLNPLGNELATDLLGFSDIGCAAPIDEWTIWFYDQTRDELIKYDLNRRNIRFRSPSITQILGRENKVLGVSAGADRLILSTDAGRLEFDRFGALKSIELENGLKKTVLQGGLLWFEVSGELFQSPAAGVEARRILSLPKDCVDWAVGPNRLYLLFRDRLEAHPLE